MKSSLDESINMLVKQYSSLFTLPTLSKIILYMFILCFIGSITSALSVSPSISGISLGTAFAAFFALLVILLDFIISKTAMRNDAIFNFRRCLALSLFSNLVWVTLMLIGAFLAVLFQSTVLWSKLLILGFCAALILRLIVFLTVSMNSYVKIFLSAVIQPSVCVALIFLVSQLFDGAFAFFPFNFLVAALPLSFLSVFLFVYSVDRVGKKSVLGVSTFSLFKAFMANWTENLNAPLETIFEELGEEREVQVDLLAFKNKSGYKALFVVPMFHPGPFKNVGSSLIPHLIQKSIEEKLECVVAVPHGLFGHELDLTSQRQNRKVLDAILNSLSFKNFVSKASPIVRVTKENASAISQRFGNYLLTALTLAPKTTEDFPKEIGDHIYESALKHGFSDVIVINAHNSIDSVEQSERDIELLKFAASESITEAKKAGLKPLQVGAARTVPAEYGVKEGMGPGGITAIVLDVGGQLFAYIVFDGNNMVSGLREKILESLKELGIVDGEVLTSDTHVVNGVILNRRGYHPVGEAMDDEVIIRYVKNVVLEAMRNMEKVKIALRRVKISQVKVIGEEQIKAMSLIAHEAAKTAKKAAMSIFSVLGLIFIGLLVAL